MCYNMVELQEHYAQLKKSNKNKTQKKNTSCMVLFVRHIQTGASIETVGR